VRSRRPGARNVWHAARRSSTRIVSSSLAMRGIDRRRDQFLRKRSTMDVPPSYRSTSVPGRGGGTPRGPLHKFWTARYGRYAIRIDATGPASTRGSSPSTAAPSARAPLPAVTRRRARCARRWRTCPARRPGPLGYEAPGDSATWCSPGAPVPADLGERSAPTTLRAGPSRWLPARPGDKSSDNGQPPRGPIRAPTPVGVPGPSAPRGRDRRPARNAGLTQAG
jgi:hypothetical protein